MSIRIDDWFVAGNAQKTNSDWNASSGFAQILNKPTNLAHTTGNETISGVKTYTSIPLSVTPATSSDDTSVATTAYVVARIEQHSGDVTAHGDIRQLITNVSDSIDTSINSHNISNTAHSDIRQLISNTNTNIQTEIGNHNNDSLAHSDIRLSISNNTSTIASISNDLISETTQRNSDVNNLQQQIDALSSKGDVADIVGTYQDLLNYDTSTLLNKSIIKVLTDSTHDNASSYYKWNTTTSAFDYVGSEAPTYNKTEIDEMDNAVVHKAGTEEITGIKTFKNTTLNLGKTLATSASNSSFFDLNVYDASSNLRGVFQVWRGSAITSSTMRTSNAGGITSEIRVSVDDSDVVTTYAPTPDFNSNDNNIATTEWVNSNISANSGVVHTTGNESIADTKTFTGNIIKSVDLATAAGNGVTYIRTDDTSNKGRATLQSYYTNSQVYNRFATNNTTSGKYGYLDVIVKDTEEFYAGIGGNGTNLSLTKATNTTSDTTVPTMGWVNNPATATNVVHRSDTETISGNKTFTDMIYSDKSGIILQQKNTAMDTTVAPSSTLYGGIQFNDKNNVRMGKVEVYNSTDATQGYVAFGINACRLIDGTAYYSTIKLYVDDSKGTHASMPANVHATNFDGTAYRAKWGDLAEHYLTDQQYPKGTLVQFGGEKEITIAKNKVNAVITSDPGFLLNGELENSQAIALIGRVPVRVIGKVKKFDKIALSYLDGVGCVNNDSETPIGVALEDKNDSEEGLIICSVKLSF